MRRVFKARIVPDQVPDGLAEKVIKVADLGVPIAAALGDWEALTDAEFERTFKTMSSAWVARYSK